MNMPKGPFCQSCGIPMDKKELLGTNNDDSENEEYCTHCFQKGTFTAPNITLDEMMKKCTGILADKAGIPPFMAAIMVNKHVPKLKRWVK